MKYDVFLTDDAAVDLDELIDFIDSNDSPEKADYVLEKLEGAFSSLSQNPERGSYPDELFAIGLREYREIYFKPYRIIYRVMASNVHIMIVADGRRDMQSFLQRRLLQA